MKSEENEVKWCDFVKKLSGERGGGRRERCHRERKHVGEREWKMRKKKEKGNKR